MVQKCSIISLCRLVQNFVPTNDRFLGQAIRTFIRMNNVGWKTLNPG